MPTTEPEDLTVEAEDRGDRLVVTLTGELDIVGAPRLEAATLPAARAGRHVLLDLRGLDFMDSSGVRALVAAHAAAGESGGRLSIAPGPAGGPIIRLLALSGLDRVLELVEDPTAP
jgi:anti-anti-sigma factor